MTEDINSKLEGLHLKIGQAIAAEDAEGALAALRAFQHATGGDPNVLSLGDVQFRIAVQKDSDRAAGLFTAAYLDARLEELLRTYFVSDEQIADAVLDSSQPVGTFSARIDLAFLLGLLSR